MIHYLDTSALVKRYVNEAGSASVRSLFRRRQPLAAARIAQVELAAALSRLHREGALGMAVRDRLLGRLDRDFSCVTVVEIRPALIRTAVELVTRHPLRGYDAMHLAGALALRATGLAIALWAADGDLLDAATREGLRVVAADRA